MILKSRSFPLDMLQGPDKSARDAYLDALDIVRLWLARNYEGIRCPQAITFMLAEDGMSFQVEASFVYPSATRPKLSKAVMQCEDGTTIEIKQ